MKNIKTVGEIMNLFYWDRRCLVIGILIAGLLAGAQLLKFGSKEGFDITINNKTDISISGLSIHYHNITENIEIPEILPGKSYQVNVNPIEEFGENSMILLYWDRQNKSYKEYIFGYFEKGYHGRARVDILSSDETGKLTIHVKSSIGY